MFKQTKIALITSLVAVGTLFSSASFAADTFSNREVNLPIDVSKGETADLIARAFADSFEKHYKKKINIENLSAQARTEIKNADPDGFTIGITNFSAIFAKAKDASKFLEEYHVYGNLATSYNAFIVSNALQVKDWKAFESESANKKIMIAANGKGSSGYLLGQIVKDNTNAKFELVAYGNSATASNDVASNKIEGAFISSPLASQNISFGKVTPLFVTSPVRLKEMPNVPTAKEIGINGMKEVNFGIITPKNLTPQGKALLDEAVAKITKDPEFIAKFDKLGIKPNLMSSEDTIKKIIEDNEQFSKIDK